VKEVDVLQHCLRQRVAALPQDPWFPSASRSTLLTRP
jgi:hypothetical protein